MAEGAGKLDEAYDLYARSLDMRQKLWTSDPRNVLAKGRVGFVKTRLALLEIKRNRPESALVHAHEAVAIFQSLSDHTRDVASQRDLGDALVAKAEAESAVGRHAASCVNVSRALKVFDGLTSAMRDGTDEDETAIKMGAACALRADALHAPLP